MMPLNGIMDMDMAHPRLSMRQIHIQARMQNTEQMHQNKAEWVILLKTPYMSGHAIKEVSCKTSAMHCLAEGRLEEVPCFSSLHFTGTRK